MLNALGWILLLAPFVVILVVIARQARQGVKGTAIMLSLGLLALLAGWFALVVWLITH
jgi:hypothetical protein